jgi:hypothetical protein
MTVRFCEVVLELRDKWTKKVRPIKVTVVGAARKVIQSAARKLIHPAV